MIYAIGDVHGMFHKLERLYAQIMDDIVFQNLDHATIVFLGDYVDRGPDTDRVLDFLMELEDTDTLKHIFLRGNHEDMMVNVYYRDGHVDMWVENGGRQTLDAFECVTHHDFYENPRLREYMIWCACLPFMHIMGRYVFVHGGYDMRKTPGEQQKEYVMWKREVPYTLGREYDDCEFVVVHGHTPHPEPQVFKNEINVDTWACYAGKLTAACLPEDIGVYTANEISNMTEKQVDALINEEIRFLTA